VLPRLRRLLAERTGYPEELLDDDLDLEGDLGIDSIKRTEVVGALLRDLPGTDGRTAGSLRGVRTLSQLAEAMEASTASEPTAGPPRLVPEMVDLPTAVGTQQPTGPVLIIDRNSAGVAAATASALAEQQITAEIITATDPGTVGTGCTGARNRLGTPGGLLYLAGLDGKVDDRSDETTVLQCLAAALRTCGGSMTDGTFALAAVPDATPGAAAVAGFLITYAAERPDVRVRSIRFGRGLPNELIIDRLLAECRDSADSTEVDYPDRMDDPAGQGRILARTTTRFRPVSHRGNGQSIVPDAVVLLTGGGRGITAELAEGLGRRGAAHLVLAGRTAVAADPIVEQVAADLSTAGTDLTREALRAGLVRALATDDARPTAAHLERMAVGWERRREVLGTLDRLRSAGISVEYVQLDITDGPAVAAAVDRIHSDHGRLDIVVHGAGVLADHRVTELTPEQIDQVLQTKITGARNLAAAVRKDSLRRLLMITSVAGWYGNPGQAAYAAANRVLDALAADWDAHWPCPVTSISFGPWDGSGMATEQIRRQFRQRGVEVIDRAAGVAAFLDEIDQHPPTPHVLIGRGPWLQSTIPDAATRQTPERVAEPEPLTTGSRS
jgi:NAD(P)-dependent dehydrogenase (short-subunit alcohol dehydrogenase family)